MWAPHHQHRLWAAVSRAVRTPSRADDGLKVVTAVFPTEPFSPGAALTINGNNNFDSEEVISYEFGYRTIIIDDVSIDFTTFYNDYKNLRSVERRNTFFNGTFLELPLVFDNNNSALTYGFEIATVWQMLDWWRWDINYSLLKMDFEGQDAAAQTGISPQQSVSFRSVVSPLKNINLDLLFRYVDTYIDPDIKGYISMDIRLAWRPVSDIELSLTGQNLLAENHLEYLNDSFPKPIKIDRGMYGKLTWRF
jgi:iron complex outermembrane receptor protein